MYTSHSGKRTIQQLPIPSRKGHNAILKANYIEDIIHAIGEWSCERLVLVYSKALDANTDVVSELKKKLGHFIVGNKAGVGAHSPYQDVLEITSLLNERGADCLLSIGSSSYSDACKIARLMQTNLAPQKLTPEAMEALVNQEKGTVDDLKNPTTRLILVPTSLSASEWNNTSSATSPTTKKKQHFSSPNAAPDLILLDPEVASTSPRKLWLASGIRAVDHCVETMVNDQCNFDAFHHMEDALAVLLKGLKDYREGESNRDHEELVDGISQCQLGSRNAMMGLLLWSIPMGPSHAIGRQLGSICGVMHGVTSCIMLAPVLRYTYERNDKQKEVQNKLLQIWNKILKTDEKSLADAVENFVEMLNLPRTLREVEVTKDEVIEKVAESTLTEMLGAQDGLAGSKDQILKILNMARG
ncbi:Dehydroquinate synthase-like protein [Didymella exigua CBS 183.55]|uniref:Dehydroquinate synthase-like protein n=1 Tax=Didymella exigua CBS 183.55 TaxID=1150837 RepID=A0A6A5S1A9_9PLEO|nr:Dehydroquinate synthase-like protein [Didymella exigua CBS 183.55]KAF1933234.1 Dehydroquinate synthase-like protein [Didymella exigua CBS 183.55]